MQENQLRLLLASGFGSRSAKLGELLQQYGSATSCWDNQDSWLSLLSKENREFFCSVNTDQCLSWFNHPISELWQIIAITDDNYPPLLRHLSDAPGILFVQGDVELLSQPQLALVGSRGATAEGLTNAKQLAHKLAQAGFVITSGLALGIDAAAHKGALETGLTIAVMGTGPDKIYPSRNQALAKNIVAKGGALITEFPPGVLMQNFYFVQRNRLVSGLSLGVIVIEAAIKSGSLTTAKLAMQQGKEVFALPASVRNPMGRGCNLLLREGANWLETIDDVLDVFGSFRSLAASVTQEELMVVPESNLLSCFMSGVNSLDDLQQRSGLLLTDLMNELMDLELEGWITKVVGGYQRAK